MKKSERPPKSLDELPAVFSPSELASVMQMSRNKAYELIRNPAFPKMQIGRNYYIYKEKFVTWLDENSGHKG